MDETQDASSLGQQFVDKVRPRPSIDGERLIALFTQVVDLLGHSLPLSSELVLHDLSKLPNSVVAIHGDVTGRKVGDPATYGLLEKISDLSNNHSIDSEATLPDGRTLRCSTMIIHDVSGFAVAALCVNSDLSVWASVQKAATAMLGGFGASSVNELTSLPVPAAAKERAPVDLGPSGFAKNVDELADYLIANAIGAIGVPVDLMQKRHKVEVVRDLKIRGLFLFRESVDMLAAALGVTRFTIYNYLNEIGESGDEETKGDAAGGQPTTR